MVVTAPARRPSVGTRRTGYAIAAAINAALLYAIDLRPGWQALPFFTDDIHQVLGLINLSLVTGLAANLVYLAHDPPWVKAIGDLIIMGIGLAVLVRVWQVFPFDSSGDTFEWALLVRVVLILGLVGTGIGVLVQFAAIAGRRGRPPCGADLGPEMTG